MWRHQVSSFHFIKEDSDSIWSGNPHSTGEDPLHAAGIIGKKNVKAEDRVTSFHVYPDGTVRFSKKEYGEIKLPEMAVEETQLPDKALEEENLQSSSTPAEGSGSAGTKK